MDVIPRDAEVYIWIGERGNSAEPLVNFVDSSQSP